MNQETYKLAVFSLALIALGCIASLLILAFAPGDTSTSATVFSTTLVGCVTAIAGIVQLPGSKPPVEEKPPEPKKVKTVKVATTRHPVAPTPPKA